MPKTHKNRCIECSQKLVSHLIAMHTCKCKGTYCKTHMHAHNCNFDFKAEFRDKNHENMQVLEADKIIKL
jgi:predicted nucleic acid binding AN1-type Zn finger protein